MNNILFVMFVMHICLRYGANTWVLEDASEFAMLWQKKSNPVDKWLWWRKGLKEVYWNMKGSQQQ